MLNENFKPIIKMMITIQKILKPDQRFFEFSRRNFRNWFLKTFGAILLCSIVSVSQAQSTERNRTLATLENLKTRASDLVMNALSLLGIRYRFGGTTPEGGLDCSGFVGYVFKQSWGAKLPRTAKELSQVSQSIDMGNMQPGDLVFYNTRRRQFSHVGIYLGDNKFIHAPSQGGNIRIESMNVGYWRSRFDGARRIADPFPRQQAGLSAEFQVLSAQPSMSSDPGMFIIPSIQQEAQTAQSIQLMQFQTTEPIPGQDVVASPLSVSPYEGEVF